MAQTLSNKQYGDEDRITLIAMWNDDNVRTYIPMFLASAIGASQSVDLLWVNVIEKENGSCADVSKWVDGAKNVRTLCLTRHEVWEMSADWLCSKNDGWACTTEDRDLVVGNLTWRPDGLNCQFKPFRGLIFEKYLRTDWYAWIDIDTFIGE